MKILIVKTSSLGDIVHTFATLGLIKKRIPEATVDWVVEKPSKELLEAHPDISQVIPIDTRAWRKNVFSSQTRKEFGAFRRQLQQKEYDVVFDFQGNTKSAIVTWLAKAPIKVGFSRPAVAEWPNLLVTNQRYLPSEKQDIRSDYQSLVRQFFKISDPYNYEGICLRLNSEEKGKAESILNPLKEKQLPLVMVCPGSNWKNKQLADPTLKELLKKLNQQCACHLLFAWGSDSEHQLVQSLASEFTNSTILEKLSLPLLQNLMGNMTFVIAMDSLALHLGGTTATSTFSVFGPSSSLKYKPQGNQHHAYQGACPYGKQFPKRCPILRTCSTGACMNESEDLFVQFEKFIADIFPSDAVYR